MTLAELRLTEPELAPHIARVRKLARARMIQGLIEELKSPIRGRRGAWTLRGEAAWQLGLLRAKPASKAIAGMLNDHDPNVRARAARALGLIGDNDPTILGALASAARSDSDDSVRAFALASLGEIGDSAVLETIAPFARDSRRAIRNAAIYGLLLIGGEPAHASARAALGEENWLTRRRLLKEAHGFNRKWRSSR